MVWTVFFSFAFNVCFELHRRVVALVPVAMSQQPLTPEFVAHLQRVQHGIVCCICGRPHVGPFAHFGGATFCFETCWKTYSKNFDTSTMVMHGIDGEEWVLVETTKCCYASLIMTRTKGDVERKNLTGRIVPVSEQRQVVIN